MKPLLSTLKEKKRYLAVKTLSDSQIPTNKIQEAIKDQMKEYVGEKGLAKAGLQFIQDKWNQTTQEGMIRVSHNMITELKASLTLIDNINNSPVTVQSLGASGILKKANKKYITQVN